MALYILFDSFVSILSAALSVAPLVAVVISLVASLPYLIKLYLYYSWTPELFILPDEYELLINHHRLSKVVVARVEIYAAAGNYNSPGLNKELKRLNLLEDHAKYSPGTHPDYWNEILFTPRFSTAFDFQVEKWGPVTVRVCPTVRLSEFQPCGVWLPAFYGDAELQPIERTIPKDYANNQIELDKEYLKRVHNEEDFYG